MCVIRGYHVCMPQPNLRQLAKRAMIARGFLVDIPREARAEVAAQAEPVFDRDQARDLRSWFWSSIDNDESRDLDQAEYAAQESGGTRLYVAIADVDSLVYRGSMTDRAAEHNATSVYTGVLTFPMLPERLSTDLTSLNEREQRLAIVVEMLVSDEGRVAESFVYAAMIENKAQLTYNAVASWLDGSGKPSGRDQRTLPKIESSPELQEQLRLQDRAAERLRKARHEAGALTFHSSEINPVFSADGTVLTLEVRRQSRASLLIEDLMIASNEATARFLDQHGSPSLRRVVKIPQRWDRIVSLAASLGQTLPPDPDVKSLEEFLDEERRTSPAEFPDVSLAVVKLLGRGEYLPRSPGGSSPGHFALAANAYSHSTAPNRRFPDLITQRLIKSVLSGTTPSYSMDELNALAAHCTEREDAATKVERFVKKCAAAVLLGNRIGDEFDGVISGVTDRGTWVRLSHPPVEGKIYPHDRDLDVGDRVRVRLSSVDAEQGFIDFELA
jgi:VacB/RNase II family 3'-5' exoribonuclease